MTETIFRSRVEPSQTQEIASQEVKPLINDEIPVGAKKSVEPQNFEEKNLDIWEGMNRRKYGEDYFNIREISHTFPIKAEFAYIDKYIKSELSERNLENNIENYATLLQEIENEIGTSKTETYSRINKIMQYLKVLTKLKETKLKKDSFRTLLQT